MVDSLNREYITVVDSISERILASRVRAIRRVNSTMMELYWDIGEYISSKKLIEGYGKGVVERLSGDLKLRFPEMGLSARNLWNMKRFYERYRDSEEKLQRIVAELPWRHNLLIISKTQSDEEAMHYIEKSIELSLSRDMLLNYIKADDYSLHLRGDKSHNFATTLPQNIATQADEIIKSSYNLGFLGVTDRLHELNFEKRLVEKIKSFILELGRGFTFIGNQYRLEYSGKEYVIDMLFFNRQLRSIIAIDLKMGEFKPEYVGKMNFYLNLLDIQVKMEDENPSIGIILCADKEHAEVELALQGVTTPIGVAEYQLQEATRELKDLVHRELLVNKT